MNAQQGLLPAGAPPIDGAALLRRTHAACAAAAAPPAVDPQQELHPTLSLHTPPPAHAALLCAFLPLLLEECLRAGGR